MLKPMAPPHETETPHLSLATTKLIDTVSTPMLLRLPYRILSKAAALAIGVATYLTPLAKFLVAA